MAVFLSGRLVPTYQTTWYHEPEEHFTNSLVHEIQLRSSTNKRVEICGFNNPESLNNPITHRCFIYRRKYNRYGEEKHTHKHRSFVDLGNRTLLFDFQNIPETKFWMRYCNVSCATLYKSKECEHGRSINESRRL